jgi:hypothetical protein
MVDICSSSPIPPPPLSRSPPQFALNHTQPAGNEPLPSLEGCGLNFKPLNSLRNADSGESAPPLSTGMWAAYGRSMEDWGVELGMRKYEGEPKTTTTAVTTKTIPTAPNLGLPPTRTPPLSRGMWVSFFTIGGGL